jgi:hypothetical protein
MASQNWDDHDRPESIPQQQWPNILIPAPLMPFYSIWQRHVHYAQEIEHVRTDIKIVNTSLLWRIGTSTRWKQNIWTPISFTHDQYVGDKLDYVVYPQNRKQMGDKDFMYLKSKKSTVVCNDTNQIKKSGSPLTKMLL